MATVEQPKKASQRKPSPERWEAWKKHLAKRNKPVPLSKLIAIKRNVALLWALPAEARDTETQALLVRLNRLATRGGVPAAEVAADLEQWLESARVRDTSPQLALESLAWCHALPALAGLLPAAPWSQLVEHLTATAAQAATSDLTANALTQQLLAGELPLALAYVVPELPACRQLAEPARETLSFGLTELLDGKGMPHARYLSIARALFACWTRSLYLGRTMKRNCFTKPAKVQYAWLVRAMLRLCRYDGSQVFDQSERDTAATELFEAALTLVDDTDDDEIADCLLPGRKAPKEPRSGLPRATTHSEWAELAVLRRGWQRSSDQLAVRYDNRELQLELNCGSETVFSGVCNPELRVDGRLLQLEQDWEEVCWQTDRDLDYLELEGRYENGWTVQRQMLLAREDRFLLVADAVLGSTKADIHYQLTLPLCDGIRFTPAEETRDGVLAGRKPIGAVLPLHLPEWRAEKCLGSLESNASGLRLQQQVQAQRLFAPLFFDLKPKRFSRQLTWRRLTVAQRLENQPADVAVGYRVQVGNRQWVAYRSLAPAASRSVLGQHFSGEFILGRFPAAGELEQLIEIESPAE